MLAAPAPRRASVNIVTAMQAAGVGRSVRWILLLCTVFGLATMHTLGQAGVNPHTHGPSAVMSDAVPATSAGAAQPGVTDMASAASGGHCPDDHCGGQHDHGGMSGWAVCLAVLGGLAVAVLLAALLLMPATRFLASSRERRSLLRAPRPPPRQRVGLTVASVAVLRT